MSKSLASVVLLGGVVALSGACSSEVNGGNGPNGPNGTSGSGNPGVAGSTGTPTAGASSVAGSTGNPTAGAGTGGAGTGGAGNTAGAGMGGTTSTAGATGTGGVVNPGDGGPGYWVEKDWHGCAWTSKGSGGETTITPADFVAKPPADAFCVSGSVGPTYESVAILGFNVNQPTSTSCVAKAPDPNAVGEPSVTPMADGLAVNFVKKGANTAFTLRVQVQGPNGHKEGAAGEADRWCATITETQGKVFVPYTMFTPKCWEATADKRGTPYAKQPISAVSFTVPGTMGAATPYDFCVNGFTYGTKADDAPDGPAVAGDQVGKVGTTVSPSGDFARAKVKVGGKDYIIQNNNWGNPSGTNLILSYKNNSFVITEGSGTGASAPASFPSIYIGNNGETANGVYSTKGSDGLPVQISAITSLPSTLRYSGSTNVYNAAYDIWFANSIPTAAYNDGIDGFVMIWLRDPGGKQPIGSLQETVTIAGQSWGVWVGPRGDGPAGYNDAPVVSFVNPTENDNSRAQSFKNVDLKAFFTAAAKHGISSNMYLTDVFGGFEIWDGGAGGNLAVDEFTAVVNK